MSLELQADLLIEGQKIHIHSHPCLQSLEENSMALPAESGGFERDGEGRSQAEASPRFLHTAPLVFHLGMFR